MDCMRDAMNKLSSDSKVCIILLIFLCFCSLCSHWWYLSIFVSAIALNVPQIGIKFLFWICLRSNIVYWIAFESVSGREICDCLLNIYTVLFCLCISGTSLLFKSSNLASSSVNKSTPKSYFQVNRVTFVQINLYLFLYNIWLFVFSHTSAK